MFSSSLLEITIGLNKNLLTFLWFFAEPILLPSMNVLYGSLVIGISHCESHQRDLVLHGLLSEGLIDLGVSP